MESLNKDIIIKLLLVFPPAELYNVILINKKISKAANSPEFKRLYVNCYKYNVLLFLNTSLAHVNPHYIEKWCPYVPEWDPSKSNNYLFRKVCEYGYVKLARLLLNDSRVDPEAFDGWAIRIACQYGRFSIVELLVNDERVNVNVSNGICVRMAGRKGHYDIVKLLLERGAEIKYISKKDVSKMNKRNPKILELIDYYRFK